MKGVREGWRQGEQVDYWWVGGWVGSCYTDLLQLRRQPDVTKFHELFNSQHGYFLRWHLKNYSPQIIKAYKVHFLNCVSVACLFHTMVALVNILQKCFEASKPYMKNTANRLESIKPPVFKITAHGPDNAKYLLKGHFLSVSFSTLCTFHSQPARVQLKNFPCKHLRLSVCL